MKSIYPTALHRKVGENLINSLLTLFFLLPLAPLGYPHFLFFPPAQLPGDTVHILHMCRIFVHPFTSYSGTAIGPKRAGSYCLQLLLRSTRQALLSTYNVPVTMLGPVGV